MAYDLSGYYKLPAYEYLVRWPCSSCRINAGCPECQWKGYLEDWVSLEEVFHHRPVTIVDYRLAGMPDRAVAYSNTLW